MEIPRYLIATRDFTLIRLDGTKRKVRKFEISDTSRSEMRSFPEGVFAEPLATGAVIEWFPREYRVTRTVSESERVPDPSPGARGHLPLTNRVILKGSIVDVFDESFPLLKARGLLFETEESIKRYREMRERLV